MEGTNILAIIIPFFHWILFRCILMPHFVWSFTSWWHLDISAFWLLWVMHVWTFVYRFLNTCFHSLIFVLGSGIVRRHGNSLLTFWGTTRLFSTASALFCIPIKCFRIQSLHIFTNASYFSFFCFLNNYPSEYEVVSRFDLHFPSD